MNSKLAIIASIGAVIIALGFLVYTGLSQNMVYYYHVDEFLPKAAALQGEVIKLNGRVTDGSIQKNQMDYRFLIHGTKPDVITVSYHGVVPDTFKDGCDVVVEGIYNPATHEFQATTLMAKCPTKYESQTNDKQSKRM
ncbi:MAG: hypothetical protein C5B54_05800 [Acidobacteria bacterium]|nr:MAG: hypothetical protein C5B54_05800 [Acidobacteriota bacterium]